MNKLPRLFREIPISGLEHMERRAIERHDLHVRFTLRRAGIEGNEPDQKEIIRIINNDPTWIGIETSTNG